jgi:ligand-binding SRPBCC domain-containing protein
METIRLATWIDAPVERCFLLSLNIDLRVASCGETGEDVVGGVTSGLIGEGQTVTFQGHRFGVRWKHTSRMEIVRPYSYFREVMVDGHFKRYEHEHHFAAMDDGTRIRDEVTFSLRWSLGRLGARRRLAACLKQRNALIKRVAESEEWRKYLGEGAGEQTAVAPVKEAPPRRWNGASFLGGSQRIVLPRGPHS